MYISEDHNFDIIKGTCQRYIKTNNKGFPSVSQAKILLRLIEIRTCKDENEKLKLARSFIIDQVDSYVRNYITNESTTIHPLVLEKLSVNFLKTLKPLPSEK